MPITVIVNNNKPQLKEIHHLSARKELESEYKRRDRILSGVSEVGIDGKTKFTPLKYIQDIPTLKFQRDIYKKNYEKGLPEKLSPEVMNELWKKAKRLKDQFIIGMVSKHEMHPVKEHAVFANGKSVIKVVADYDKLKETRAIERNLAWEKMNAEKIREFKNIMRQLEPDDPNLPNIERFRPA